MAGVDAPSRARSTAAPSVWVVVLNRRGRAYTIDCLRAVARLSYPNLSLVLIDNGSQDFSAEEVTQQLPGAHYLRVAINRGFTGGVNLGIRTALEHGGEYVFLLNNDATIDADAIGELIQVAQSDPHIGIVGAKLLQLDAPGRLESAGLSVDLRLRTDLSDRLRRTRRGAVRRHDRRHRGQWRRDAVEPGGARAAPRLRRSVLSVSGRR